MKLARLILLPVLALAQSYSAHSGWNFDDTLHAATDIVVGQIVSGTGVDSGSEVRVRATVRIVRVLQGSLAPGMDLPLEWQYQPAPNEGPAVTSSVPKITSLFFLRLRSSGTFEALRAASLATQPGSVILPVPAMAPASALLYTQDLPLQGKVAREIAAAMQDLAMREPEVATMRPATADARNAAMAYRSLSMSLDQIDQAQSLPVFQYLSTLNNINLRTAGLLGRLSSGDASAIFEVEADLSRIAAHTGAIYAGPRLLEFAANRDMAAFHSLARIGLSETPLPGVEGGMPFRLASTHNPEFLPYLITMLGSPDSGIRGGTIMGICSLLSPSAGDRGRPQGLWTLEMNAHCPDHSPLNDRELERQHIEFWTGWWNSHREEIGKSVNLPVVIAPARYSVRQSPGFTEVTDVPLEVRLQSLLGMNASRSQATHYHAAGGVVNAPPPGPPDPVIGQLPEADRGSYTRIVNGINSKLEENRQAAMAVINAARVTGTPTERSQLEKAETERQAILSSALRELRSGISPEGWQALERFLMSMNIHMMRATQPAK